MAQTLSETKQFAFKVLECFDDLAKPEIKNVVFETMWNYLKSHVGKIILKKKDNELKENLRKIHKTLGPMFKDIDISTEYQESLKIMGNDAPKIPDVGELGRKLNLVKIDEDKAAKLLEELL